MEDNYAGSLKITNPKTLERWKESGEFQKLEGQGWIYAKGCGRFKFREICTCSKCRKEKSNV